VGLRVLYCTHITYFAQRRSAHCICTDWVVALGDCLISWNVKAHSHQARLRPSTDVDALGVNGPLVFDNIKIANLSTVIWASLIGDQDDYGFALMRRRLLCLHTFWMRSNRGKISLLHWNWLTPMHNAPMLPRAIIKETHRKTRRTTYMQQNLCVF